jgi:GrpB-like predicted nucleotidyltransferase (UPF0157 family)
MADDGIFHSKPWDPAVKKAADDLIVKIHETVPELEVLFMGAVALGLPGKNDIDLDILSPLDQIPENTKRLEPVLGAPTKVTDTLAEWTFVKDGIEIDCIISDPAISHVPRQRKNFEALKNSPELLEEYRRFKESCDGLPNAEYSSRKRQFIEEIIEKRS